MTTQSVAKTDGAVVELVSFTPQELDIITDALRTAATQYNAMCEMQLNTARAFPQCGEQCRKHAEMFALQSQAAGELQLKIEAAR